MIRNMMSLVIIIITFIGIISCEKDEIPDSKPPSTKIIYSFFVAGHTYGDPMNPQHGFYPPFLKAIPFINKYPKMELGLLAFGIIVFIRVKKKTKFLNG